MSDYTHTRHIEEAPSQIQEGPPVAQWPFGETRRVYCQDTSGEKFKYELVEHSAQRAVKAVKSLDESVVRALCEVK